MCRSATEAASASNACCASQPPICWSSKSDLQTCISEHEHHELLSVGRRQNTKCWVRCSGTKTVSCQPHYKCRGVLQIKCNPVQCREQKHASGFLPRCTIRGGCRQAELFCVQGVGVLWFCWPECCHHANLGENWFATRWPCRIQISEAVSDPLFLGGGIVARCTFASTELRVLQSSSLSLVPLSRVPSCAVGGVRRRSAMVESCLSSTRCWWKTSNWRSRTIKRWYSFLPKHWPREWHATSRCPPRKSSVRCGT